MARKHNKRANKRSTSIDIKAYAQALEGVFKKYPTRKFNYKQLAAQLGYKPAMVKAKIEMALADMERNGTILMVDRGKYKLTFTVSPSRAWFKFAARIKMSASVSGLTT